MKAEHSSPSASPRRRGKKRRVPYLVVFVSVGLLLWPSLSGGPRELSNYYYYYYQPQQQQPQQQPQRPILNHTTHQESITANKHQEGQEQELEVGHTTDQQQQHHESLEYLPLHDWELESIQTRKCQPPTGIPTQCCIGSISSGGQVRFNADDCDKGLETYRRMEERALQLLQDHFPLPNSTTTPCDICRILEILWQQNWTMAFQGDSMTRQTFSGLECELHRRGYKVVDRQVLRHPRNHTKKARWRYELDQTVELTVVQQEPLDGGGGTMSSSTNNKAAAARSANIRYYAMYRPLEDMSEVAHFAADNDVLVFDHGLHYMPQEVGLFRRLMTDVIRTAQHSNLKLLLWRENSAQPYNSTGGHYVGGKTGVGCVRPTTEMLAEAGGFRYNATQQVLQQQQPQSSNNNNSSQPLFRILPFRAYTMQFYDLHLNSMQKDCSHFCSTPSLWLYLWRTLRLALEEAVRLRVVEEEEETQEDGTKGSDATGTVNAFTKSTPSSATAVGR